MTANVDSNKSSFTNNSRNMSKSISKFTKEYASLVAILFMLIVFSFASPYFFNAENFTNILLQTATVGIVTIGQALLITTGQFDLSLGQNACLSGIVAAYLMKIVGLNPVAAIIIALAVGTFIGACNGFLYAYCGIPAFMATLGFMYVCKGFAKIISNATPIANLPASIGFLGRGYIGPIPISVIIMVGFFIVFQFISRKTRFGRKMYAVGGGTSAAYYSGINTKRISLYVFTIAGFLSAAGGIVLVSRLNSAAITNGNQYEFDAVIASVIGGISLTGGKGKIIGALFGSIFLVMFFNGMTMLNVDPFYQDVIKGFVLVAAIGIDILRNRRKN